MTQTLTTQKEQPDLVEYVPFGAEETIKLTVAIVQNIIAVPTKSGKLPSRNDAIKFLMLCRARHLNPFTGDAFLLGYDTQHGPQFSLITAHQVFLMRAEASDEYDGMESGVIIMTEGSPVEERQGDFFQPKEGEKLLGGWARVFRKDRKKPTYRRLNLETFSTGRSRWEKDPAGMIVKCAEADALRSTFPTHLGGLYTQDEAPTRNIEAQVTSLPTGSVGRIPDPDPQPQKTVSELAAEEALEHQEQANKSDVEKANEEPKQEEAPKEEKKPPGPTAASLVKVIITKGGEINVGKVAITKALIARGILEANETLDALTPKKAADVLDAWPEIKDSILHPEEPQ